jgi:hypothetical protein
MDVNRCGSGIPLTMSAESRLKAGVAPALTGAQPTGLPPGNYPVIGTFAA